MYMGQGCSYIVLTVGTWAGFPADSAYIRAGVSSCLQWVHIVRVQYMYMGQGCSYLQWDVGWVSS